MAVSCAVAAFKQGLLRHVRLPLQQQSIFGSAAAAGTSLSLWRGFAGGGYLDKDDVTSRVLEVTKHFEKIDPAKVRPPGPAAGSRKGARASCCCLIWGGVAAAYHYYPAAAAHQHTPCPSRHRSTL
jgi:NADH dehydrogenase (ubiquinone) 1 alpha/beta subcomplex 1